MKIRDIKQRGFYEAVPFNKEYHEIYEILEDPELGLCLDVWIYDYTDSDGRKRYEADGGLYSLETKDFANLDVTPTKEKWFMPELELNAGHLLIEDKLTYKEQLDKIKEICEKASTKSTFCNGVENKDMQKLAIKILNIILK